MNRAYFILYNQKTCFADEKEAQTPHKFYKYPHE